MAKQQRIVLYEGDVQGVGFRYTATHLAGGYDVAGYVRNLSDGRVELVAEGEDDQVEAFLAALEQRFRRYIQSRTVRTFPFSGDYSSFGVRQ